MMVWGHSSLPMQISYLSRRILQQRGRPQQHRIDDNHKYSLFFPDSVPAS